MARSVTEDEKFREAFRKLVSDELARADDNGMAPSPDRKRGRPRLEVVSKTLRATKPWLELGMSERTWYRRQAEKQQGK